MSPAEPSLTQTGPIVSHYMSAPVVILRDHDSIWHAVDRFIISGLHHMVVLDQHDNFLGVVKDHQVLPACLPLETVGVRPRSVGQVMRALSPTATDQRVSPAASMQTAAAIMLGQHVDALAVVDARGRVQGVVTMTDLVRAFMDAQSRITGEAAT